jgi:hypothetical protein
MAIVDPAARVTVYRASERNKMGSVRPFANANLPPHLFRLVLGSKFALPEAEEQLQELTHLLSLSI